MQVGNGAVYEPLQPYAVAVTGLMIAPLAVEPGLAAMANPGAMAAAANIAAEMAGVTGTAGAAGLAAKEIGPLLQAAGKPFNASGLSVAARKVEQHATRPGGTFAAPTGSVAQKNETASRVVEGLLKSPGTVKSSLSAGGVEYRSASGQGVRFEADGAFNRVWILRKNRWNMTGFSIDYVSPMDFESLAAEISFNSQLLCRIDQERVDGVLEIEFFHLTRAIEAEVKMKFSLPEFLKIVEDTCSELRATSSWS